MKEYYAAPLVDAADENANHQIDRTFDTLINISVAGMGLDDEQKAELKRHLNLILKDYAMDSFVDGAQYAIENKLETVHKTEDNPCDYVKNKDFCVMLDYHDNDFGGYLEEAAQSFADKYNSIIGHINLYSKHSDVMVESYIKDLEIMEKLENIKKLLRMGFIGSYMTSSIDRWYEDVPEDRVAVDNATEYLSYLGLYGDENFKIGTYSEIESYVMERYKNQQSEGEGTSLKTCWLNGEVLFMAVIDGVMKVWVQ